MYFFPRDKGEEKKYSVLLCPEPKKAVLEAPPPQGGTDWIAGIAVIATSSP